MALITPIDVIRGIIDGSVLVFVAQLLVLCATFLGIKDYTNLINRKSS